MTSSRISVACATALVLLSAACGQSRSTSEAADVEDIVSMQARGDGNFDVLCRDGRHEVATPEDVRLDRVCDGGGGGGGGGGGSGELICVARDNDGRDPWVFGRLTDSGSIVRIPGILFSTLATCQQASRDSARLGRSTLVCIARDNDGRDPWISAAIDDVGSVTRHSTTYSTLNACTDTLRSGLSIGDSLLLCAARDNDGRDPWIFSVLSDRGNTRVSGPLFTTITQCQDTLRSGRRTGSSLLVCVPRDNDGRDPWIIGSIREDGSYTPNAGTVFSTLDQCRSTLGGG